MNGRLAARSELNVGRLSKPSGSTLIRASFQMLTLMNVWADWFVHVQQKVDGTTAAAAAKGEARTATGPEHMQAPGTPQQADEAEEGSDDEEDEGSDIEVCCLASWSTLCLISHRSLVNVACLLVTQALHAWVRSSMLHCAWLVCQLLIALNWQLHFLHAGAGHPMLQSPCALGMALLSLVQDQLILHAARS